MASIAATAAENKPACSFPRCYAQRKIDANTVETHEKDGSCDIGFQAIDQLVIFILCGLVINGEETP